MTGDEIPGFIRSARVAVLGLGLIGGSLAMALKGRCGELLGIDPDPSTLALARQLDLCSQLSADPALLLPQADVVILAAPVRAILDLIRRLPSLHPGRAIVLDVGSTKQEVVRALTGLPERFDPLGGHPMCGKEGGSLASAEPGLFQGAVFAFTPLPRTSARAREFASGLARLVGSQLRWMEPEVHDTWAAYTSHLAYLVSAAMALAVPPEAAPLASSGFRSTTRLAAADPRMMNDILTTNRRHVLEALAGFRGRIDALEAALAAGDDAALEALQAEARDRRQSILAARQPAEEQA